jgi:hypothetical protein
MKSRSLETESGVSCRQTPTLPRGNEAILSREARRWVRQKNRAIGVEQTCVKIPLRDKRLEFSI